MATRQLHIIYAVRTPEGEPVKVTVTGTCPEHLADYLQLGVENIMLSLQSGIRLAETPELVNLFRDYDVTPYDPENIPEYYA